MGDQRKQNFRSAISEGKLKKYELCTTWLAMRRQLGRFEVNEKPEKQPNDQNCGCVISERDMGAASYGPVMDRSEIIEASILQT